MATQASASISSQSSRPGLGSLLIAGFGRLIGVNVDGQSVIPGVAPRGFPAAISKDGGGTTRTTVPGDTPVNPDVVQLVTEEETPQSPVGVSEGESSPPAVTAPPESGANRTVRRPTHRLPSLTEKNRGFVLERLRHAVVRTLLVREKEGGILYVPDDVLQSFVLADEQGFPQLICDELASRLRPTETEKPFDTVLSAGDYGAIFGASMAQSLMRQSPSGGRVMQRFIIPTLPAGSGTVLCESSSKPAAPLFRITRGTSEDRGVLSNRRVVLTVPVITPENWELISDQFNYLRGGAENTNAVTIVSLLRVGKPVEGLRAGLRIESFATYF